MNSTVLPDLTVLRGVVGTALMTDQYNDGAYNVEWPTKEMLQNMK